MPFVPALPTGSGVEARHLAYTAELVNTTNANLRAEYTIRLPGASPTAATVSYAELTATSEPINFDEAPPSLANLAAHRHARYRSDFTFAVTHRRASQPGPPAPRRSPSTWPATRRRPYSPLLSCSASTSAPRSTGPATQPSRPPATRASRTGQASPDAVPDARQCSEIGVAGNPACELLPDVAHARGQSSAASNSSIRAPLPAAP
jgi:hypothetical protein